MCGIAGFIDTTFKMGEGELTSTVKRITGTLVHRGPDDCGVWVDSEAGVALGHRRLSIVDLSAEGHQPMNSACGRYVVVYNGEIYNFRALADELKALGEDFRGHSDTEVMLGAIVKWGLTDALKKFNGMFAFALWDRREKVLHLVRDRLGKKPLYYGWMGKTFVFASELKALRMHPDFKADIDRGALALYMRHNYIPSPYSIYKGIRKLTPGSSVRIRSSDAGKEFEVVPYWSAKEVAENGLRSPFKGTSEEAVTALDELLRDAVSQRMVADVPLGAFLSGGIDSSLVVALMQAQSTRPVKTFSIGFHEEGYNEAKEAMAVARHLGTEHTELYVKAEEAMDVIPRLPGLYDEPFSDSSQIPTFLVSELARKQVTVSLSGDGGDELFAGYKRYFWAESIWGKVGWMPRGARSALASTIKSLTPGTWDLFFNIFGRALPAKLRQRTTGDRMHKLAGILDAGTQREIYKSLVSHWENPSAIVIGSTEHLTAFTDKDRWGSLDNFTRWMMYMDLVTYLPDDILVKVDRDSMGVSLEARAPLLDHRVVEFAWRLPLDMNTSDGKGKLLLRKLLYKYVPRELVERPKMGFGVPIDSWLRGPLRDWAEALLDEGRLRSEGILDPLPIRAKWDEHLSGRRNWQYHIWDILMFQAWKEHWEK